MNHKSLTLVAWKLLRWMAKPCGDVSRGASVFHSFRIGNDKLPRFGHFDRDINKSGRLAALELIDRGWVDDGDDFGNRRLNEAGLNAAATLPRPAWSPPPPPALVARDWDVLHSLSSSCRTYAKHLGDGRDWVSPLDCGGQNGSYHSASMVKLTRHGYAECRAWGKILCGREIVPEPRLFHGGKGSRKFRITPAGRAALVAHNDARRQE